MDISFARFIALFLLFASALGAPTGPHACTDVAKSALEFNKIVREELGKEAKGGITNLPPRSNPVEWMEAKDMCGPENLRDDPAHCIEKILNVLTSYKSFVKTVSEFESCTIAHNVKTALNKLHDDMRICVQSRTGYHHKVNHVRPTPSESWEEDLLCQYTMERLFSFSVLTARVFSVGDPSNHAEASTLKCPQN